MSKKGRRPPVTPAPSYSIVTKPAFDRAFDKLTKKDHQLAARLAKAIDKLATNPRPHGSRKLESWQEEGEDIYRLESGNYRILYVIRDKTLLVVLLDVGDRKQIYRR